MENDQYSDKMKIANAVNSNLIYNKLQSHNETNKSTMSDCDSLENRYEIELDS